MDTATAKKISEALGMMGARLGVLSTIGEDGSPESAVVYFHFDEDLNIYFQTSSESRKHKNILNDSRASFVAYSEHPPKTFQMKGFASLIKDPVEKERIHTLLMETSTKSNVLPPIDQIHEILNKGEIAIWKIAPSWARFGDFDIYRENNMFYEAEKKE